MDVGGRTLYRRIGECISDEDLEKLVIDDNFKKEYNALVSQIPNRQGPENDTKILRRVLSKLKSVIVFDTFAKYKEAINKFRQLNRYFVCYIDEWPAEALLNISGINVSKTQIDQLSPTRLKSSSSSAQKQKQKTIIPQSSPEIDLPKLLAQVFTYTNRSMISYDEPSISIKKFQFFLTIFQQMYKHRNKQLTEKVQFYTKIYSKFYEACTLIAEWQKRVDILRVELEEQIVKLDKELGLNQLESITFSILHKKKQEEEKKVLEKNEEMASIKRQMQRQLQGMKKMMQNISKIVGSMQRAEMSELKKIYKSSQIVSFGLQCLCILLGEQPTQKSINKILADPNLMMKMKSNNLLENKNVKVVEKMKLEEAKIKDQYQSKGRFQASRVLIDWIKSVLQYWVVLQEHQKLSTSYKSLKKQYSESLKAQAQIQESLSSLKSQLLNLNKTHSQLFIKKQQTTQQYSKISTKIHNARLLLPALKKSQEQTWEVIKELRNNIGCLIGNTVLAVVCLVYLPLKRLGVKKGVIAEVKRLLNLRSVMFDQGFMSVMTGIQDAVVEDLNLVAIKQLQEFPVLIVDPERRAMYYLFEQDPHLASSITTNTLSDMSNSLEIVAQIQKRKVQTEGVQQDEIKQKKQQIMAMEQSQHINMQEINPDSQQKYVRKTPIFHTTDQNYKALLQKLPDNTFVVDWKFTTIDTTQKIFLRIASKKKPQYFSAKKQLNQHIKQNLQKIQSYKHSIYLSITQKQIKILDDHEFVEMGSKLLQLQVQTQKQKTEYNKKLQQINQYAKEINQEVSKVMCMINCLKKIKNIALDIVLHVACRDDNVVNNVVKWVLAVLGQRVRIGWMVAVAVEFVGESNQELVAILVRDAPLKVSEVSRTKKPINISNKNYDNICKIGGYTPNLKTFADSVLKYSKQFETWTLDSQALQIPSIFKPQILSMLQQLTILKLFHPKLLYPTLCKHLCKHLHLQTLTGYTNSELLQKTSCRYPILTNCSLKQIQQLCKQLNNGRICIKNIIQINDTLQLKRFIWSQMSQKNWVILHSVFDRNSREILEDLVEYVVNYQEQDGFRVFVFVDRVQLAGFQNQYEVTTKYNNVSGQASKSKKSVKTQQRILLQQSKYLENIGVSLYQELPSFKKSVLEAMSVLGIQLPEVSVEIAQMNPSISSFLNPQTPGPKLTLQKPTTPMMLSNLMPGLVQLSLGTTQKERLYFEKLVIYLSLSEIVSWLKFPKLRLSKLQPKLLQFAKYIKQYNIPLEFNMYNVAAYVATIYCSSLDSFERADMLDLMDRIFDQTKINQKSLYGVPVNKQSLALAFAGIGRGGAEIHKDWVDDKVRNNYQLLGCEESYLSHRNAEMVQDAFNTFAHIRYSNRLAKQQASQIRSALARLPTSPLVFNREVKNTLFLHCYMNELKHHNSKIMLAKQFIEWVNIASNQDYKQDDISTRQVNSQGNNVGTVEGTGSSVEIFTWANLLARVRELTGYDVPQFKIKTVLTNWLHNLKRKHQFLLYWNLDNPVLVLHPVLLVNFPMVVSTYIISYLSTNYTRIKAEGQSINKKILYTLQLQFSRQTDQKQLYMTQGILLPDLIYKQFRYNFQLKMLDGIQQWNGQQNAPLIMLKMKKVPDNLAENGRDKDNQDYTSPDIQIGTRVQNRVEIVYRMQTYIDGNFQEWALRRPMLISQ